MLAVLLSASLYAQTTAITAEVRPRSEFRNGFKTPAGDNDDAAFFTEQRSRIYLDHINDRYAVRVALQDVRLWGEEPQIFKNDAGNTFLAEAWGQYFIDERYSVRAGRQILSYDNQRFLGGLEWAQQGRRHDALLLMREDPKSRTKLHLGFAFNTDDDRPEPAYLQAPGANFYTVPGNYKALQFAWFHQDFSEERGGISLLALNDIRQNPDSTTSAKQTFGVIPRFMLGEIALAGDFYLQTGERSGRSVRAYLAGVNATFPTKLTPLTLGVEYISGQDDNGSADRLTAFSPDFGTNHAFNGFMDYFFVGPANGTVGVGDLYLKSKFKLGTDANLLVHAHQFLTGSTQLDAEGEQLDRSMGQEVDLVFVKKLAPAVTLHLGYSHLLGSETLLELRPGNRRGNNWAWTMITFKPQLFRTEEDKKKK